jgi:hypothetical protein
VLRNRSDWFHAPVIDAVTRREGRICVDVKDNVHVASVRVTIVDDQGELQAEGPAVWVSDDRWEVENAAGGKVVVEALDLAGNVTRHGL